MSRFSNRDLSIRWYRFELVPFWVYLLTALFASQLTTISDSIDSPQNTQKTQHWAFGPLGPLRTNLHYPNLSSSSTLDLWFPVANNGDASSSSLAHDETARQQLRRLSFATRGIPATLEELDEFRTHHDSSHWSRWVNRFLASPEFGVKTATLWLDAVGYADSNGYFNADSPRPHAYRYRDYVVDSINSNKPFNQFVREQIAGDQILQFTRDGDLPSQDADLLIATHFLRNQPDGTGESDGNPLEVKVDRYAVLEGAIQILGSSLLGVTLQCARCHDHKFEPVSQSDYYALQAILRRSFDPDNWLKPTERVVEIGLKSERERRQILRSEWKSKHEALGAATQGMLKPFKDLVVEQLLKEQAPAVADRIRKLTQVPEKDRTPAEVEFLRTNEAIWNPSVDSVLARFPESRKAHAILKAESDAIDRSKPPDPVLISHVAEPDNEKSIEHRMLIRGDHSKEGEVVKADVPGGLSVSRKRFQARSNPGETAKRDRLKLADWILEDCYPLLARVAVNRIWKQHFDQGLIPTLDNLGVSSPPVERYRIEILDWLASELVRSGWNLKHVHSLILNSQVFRNSTSNGHQPGPRLRRLSAEELRDAMLTVSGELDRRLGGPAIPVTRNADDEISVPESNPGVRRRSLFLQKKRTTPVSFLEVFDMPQMNPVCATRTQSTVTPQALALLNSEFVRSRAIALVKDLRLEQEVRNDVLITKLFVRTLSRLPSKNETQSMLNYLSSSRNINPESSNHARLGLLVDCAQMLMVSNEFSYLD